MILLSFILLAQTPVDSARLIPVYTPEIRPLVGWMPKQQSFECWLSHENGKTGRIAFVLSGGEVYLRNVADIGKTDYIAFELIQRPTVFELVNDGFNELTGYSYNFEVGLSSETFSGEIEFKHPSDPTVELRLNIGSTYEGPPSIVLRSVKNEFEDGKIALRRARPIALGFCNLTLANQNALSSAEMKRLLKK